jgi:hypothetical protein
MKFDNSKKIISVRINLFFATIILLTYLALAYVIEFIKFPLLGITDTVWTVVLVGIYLIIVFLPIARSYQYVAFNDEGDAIVFRYFFAGIVGGRKNTVAIPKRIFAGYKTESKIGGLIKTITLFQKAGQGKAKYPPIYISALTRDQRRKLFETLDQYSPKG